MNTNDMMCAAEFKAVKQEDVHCKKRQHVEGTDGKAGREEFKQEGMTRGKKRVRKVRCGLRISSQWIHNKLVGVINYISYNRVSVETSLLSLLTF